MDNKKCSVGCRINIKVQRHCGNHYNIPSADVAFIGVTASGKTLVLCLSPQQPTQTHLLVTYGFPWSNSPIGKAQHSLKLLCNMPACSLSCVRSEGNLWIIICTVEDDRWWLRAPFTTGRAHWYLHRRVLTRGVLLHHLHKMTLLIDEANVTPSNTYPCCLSAKENMNTYHYTIIIIVTNLKFVFFISIL